MKIIFILSRSDDYILLKTIFDMGKWFKEERQAEVILYLPEIESLDLLPHNIIEIRWLKTGMEPTELPEADIIVGTDPVFLQKVSSLNRGIVLYLDDFIKDKAELSPDIEVINFNRMKPCISDKLFQLKSEKRNKIIIGGDGLNRDSLKQLFQVIEKAAQSVYLKDVVILDAPEEYNLAAHFEYEYRSSKRCDLVSLLANSFFMIWLEKKKYPLLPLWAMAAGVVVLYINSGDKKRFFPCEYSIINPLELALDILKLYKLGNIRSEYMDKSTVLISKYRIDQTGEEWYHFFQDLLPVDTEEDFTVSIPDSHQKDKKLTEAEDKKQVVDLIIVSFNTLDHIKKCIASIKKYTETSFSLTVIDNGSSDGSLEYLKEEEGLTLIENKENYGYARACNQGILAGCGEYIVLLNSDIEVKEGWLKPLINAAEPEDIAVVGPKLINDRGQIVGAGVVDINESTPRGWKMEDGPGVFDKTEEVLSVSGACYLMKRILLPVLGLFDEGYFFYFEELDYSLRAKEKGYRVIYCPETIVYHHHEGSLGAGDYPGRKKRDDYFTESRKRFHNKWSDLLSGSEKRREPEKVVVCGLIPWDFRQQRPQHLIRNLAREGYEVIYLNPVCGQAPIREVEKNIKVWSPSGYGTILYNLKRGNETALGRTISKKLRELNFENCILMLEAPYWVSLIKYWEYSILVYDCIDNYKGFEDLSRDKEWISLAEKELLGLADIVLASSKGLYDKLKEDNLHTYILPNGVDTGHFNWKKEHEKPDDLPDSSKIAGYFGAIAAWFDVDMVAELAAKLPEVTFLLIGEVSTDVTPLTIKSNVVLLGERPYEDLPGYLSSFNLALLPFKRNELTDVTDPVKIYEYLAGGKPVLSTDLPELNKFKGVVETASNRREFIEKAKKMLAEEEILSKMEKRFNAVNKETWNNRVLKLKELYHHAYYGLYPQDEEIELEEKERKSEYDECGMDITEGKRAEEIQEEGKINVLDLEQLDLEQEELLEKREKELDENISEAETKIEKEKEKNKSGWLERVKEWFSGET